MERGDSGLVSIGMEELGMLLVCSVFAVCGLGGRARNVKEGGGVCVSERLSVMSGHRYMEEGVVVERPGIGERARRI